jgi:hypothetical protein
MQLNEAKEILKKNGYLIEDTETQDDELADIVKQQDELDFNPRKDWELQKKYGKLYDQHMDLEDKVDNARQFGINAILKRLEKKYGVKFEIEKSGYVVYYMSYTDEDGFFNEFDYRPYKGTIKFYRIKDNKKYASRPVKVADLSDVENYMDSKIGETK